MRLLVSFYLAIGIVLLVVGFLATGPCPNKNEDLVSNVVRGSESDRRFERCGPTTRQKQLLIGK